MKISFRVAAAAFALSCLSTAALAKPIGNGRDPVIVRVSHAGLDLTTAAGRAGFNARVHRVAIQACAARGATLADRADSRRCVREMAEDAAVQLAALYGDKNVQLASAVR